MKLNSPVSDLKVDKLLRLLDVKPESRVIDFGCGNGDFLLALYEKSGASCLGIDFDESLIAQGNEKIGVPATSRVELRQADAAATASSYEGELFDLTVCMGSSHAFADGHLAYEGAINSMQKLLKPNGMMLIGEGYWKRDPDPEYLEMLGEPVGIYHSFEENIAVAESFGLKPVYAVESSLDEWDDFEWNFLLTAERAVLSSPADRNLKERLTEVRKWNTFYRKFGRSTMGYAHYVLMNS